MARKALEPGPAFQVWLDTLRKGRMVQFHVDFASKNARGEHCRLNVQAYEYYEHQWPAFRPQLLVIADGEVASDRVAHWVHHDFEKLYEALTGKILAHEDVPADRTPDLATLTIHGRSSLSKKASKAMVTAMLAELLGFEVPAVEQKPAKKPAGKKLAAKKSARKPAGGQPATKRKSTPGKRPS